MKQWKEMSPQQRIEALSIFGIFEVFDINMEREERGRAYRKIDGYSDSIGAQWDKRVKKINSLHKSQYALYLRSPEWQAKRQLVLTRDHRKCQVCGSKNPLEVHHLTYARKYNESLYDLVTLCDVCHKIAHLVS